MIAAVSTRITNALDYVEIRDSISHDLVNNLLNQKITPLIIPNCNSYPDEYFKKIPFNFLVLSGGDNIIKENCENDDEITKIKLMRDKTEKLYIKFCIKKKIPIIGICRGMQLINFFFGGDFINLNNNNHVNKTHLITGLNQYKNFFLKSKFEVNSFHKNVITKETISSDLSPLMLADDNTIEAFIHKQYPILGIMWHPERNFNNVFINEFFKHNFFKQAILNLTGRS